MAKWRSSGENTSQSSNKYRPRLSEDQKAENHRKASAKYYSRNPDLREKRRIQAAQKRAELKARRRRWDPPKLPKKLEKPLIDCTHSNESDAMSQKQAEGFEHSDDLSASYQALPRPPSLGDIYHSSPRHIQFQDPRAASTLASGHGRDEDVSTNSEADAALGSAGSPNSDERLAVEVLAMLAAPEARTQSVDSILEKAKFLSSYGRYI
ncbi:hypothetical protein B0H10DRAFT_1964152 [Mycena sp. CBHHK59/15]|nr:hypothetical protein B0H10DRAFT_1964152 [Mycena sp. CBHHK59/15]